MLLARVSARFALVGGEQAGGTVTDAVAAVAPAGPPPDDPWTAAPIHRLLGTAGRRPRATAASGWPSWPVPTSPTSGPGCTAGSGPRSASGPASWPCARSSATPTASGPSSCASCSCVPVAAAGGELVAEAEVGYLGRTTATTTARLYRPDGKLAVQVDAVHAVRAG